MSKIEKIDGQIDPLGGQGWSWRLFMSEHHLVWLEVVVAGHLVVI